MNLKIREKQLLSASEAASDHLQSLLSDIETQSQNLSTLLPPNAVPPGSAQILAQILADCQQAKAELSHQLGQLHQQSQQVQAHAQQLEQAKLASEAANLAKTEFLATMSHELRTPLTAVLGLSQVLQEEIFGPLTPKQAEYVSHIYSSGEHLLDLINDMLDLVRVEAGREELALTQVNLPQLCQDCLTLITPVAANQGLTIAHQFDPQAESCQADERRLKQILLNLLANAVKFTPNGMVSLGTQRHSQGITITVSDTGIGIPAEKIPLLFVPFTRFTPHLDRQSPGTGLGLTVARNLAQLHGGDITVTSTVGVGSQFTLALPDRATSS
jgi:signal transduction histidine kinase